MIPENTLTEEERYAIGVHLMSRLEGLHLIEKKIKPDWNIYRATHRELNKMHVEENDRISRVRVSTIAWLRAHQKMAAGVKSPAEWFEINDLPAQLFKLGTDTIF